MDDAFDMITKTHDLPNFRRLMREVQLNDTTPEAAAGMIDEYIKSEVARRTSQSPCVELGLHPLNAVQDCADRLARDHCRVADRMVVVLLREYAMLRRRMADDRLRAIAASAPVPKLPPKLKNAEAQLFEALRELGQAQEITPAPPPDRRQDGERRNDK